MNERIKELAVKAGGVRNYGYERGEPIERVSFSVDNLEKFAEIIIQDAIKVLMKRYMGDNNREDMEVMRCIATVKKHFGVTE